MALLEGETLREQLHGKTLPQGARRNWPTQWRWVYARLPTA
jgi:hypothetical protein